MNPDADLPDDPIEDAAAEWLALREEGLSSAQLRDFDRWCRADPRHAAAVARLEAACAMLEKMPLVREQLLPVVEFPLEARAMPPAPTRRLPMMRILFAAAAVLTLAALGVWQWSRPAPVKNFYTTTAGGYERVVLADGSVVELNANTEVRVDLAPRERRIELVTGEAHFSVAHDTARPFIVSVNGVSVRAVGTAFNVRLGATAVEVLVTEGRVAVKQSTAPSPASSDPTNSATAPAHDASAAPANTSALGALATEAATFISANERVSLPTVPETRNGPAAAPAVEAVSAEVVHATLSWQERQLVFNDTPLRDVVAQFNRRNRMQLVLADESLGDRPMGGTFTANNVEAFVRLLESSPAIVVERRGESTTVLRRAK